MTIRPFVLADLTAIHTLLTSNRWDFYTEPSINVETLQTYNCNYFIGTEVATFVYENEDKVLKGYIRFFDIENTDSSAPLFDIKVVTDARGQGIGTALVQYAVAYIFKQFEQIRRIEATTREDNLAMQKVLRASGFVHEATYRKAWKAGEGSFMDSFGYALLRKEFQAQKYSVDT